MKNTLKALAIALAMPFVAGAQTQQGTANGEVVKKDSSAGAVAAWNLVPQIQIQNFRPADQRGVNVFEAPKAAGVPFTGFKLQFGAAFRQQFQGLDHRNTAAAVMSGTSNVNQLIAITNGFNLADANLMLNMQLAEGIRVHLSSYMSSKHHQETWVKDGYALIDKSPFDVPVLNSLMKYTTLKLGHFETNFGDQHFRRSDNGAALYNPFVGNLLIDAFTTEVGGEVYLRTGAFLAMAGANSGTIQGGVTKGSYTGTALNRQPRSGAYLGKLGVDKQVFTDLRVRLTGSYYKNDKSPSNTLLTGDRAGSAYDLVMENTAASTTANAWSGNMRSINFSNSVRAVSVSPFIKYRGLEFFGVADDYKGKAFSEPSWRTWKQQSGELVYRFWNEKIFSGARINAAKGGLLNTATINYGGKDVSLQRNSLSTGWFVTPTMLLKGEYMQQKYFGFPTTDIRNGGKIQGFVVEGVVSF